MKPFIQVNHLSYYYPSKDGNSGKGAPVINDVSLDIQEGEWITVVGQNGSGKTTLIRHLNGALLPSEGTVAVGGLTTHQPANLRQIRQWVGMVFQQPADQIIASTVEEDTAFAPENAGLPLLEIHRRVEDSLRTVGLWDLRQRPSHMLSAGQTQRLALAGVLATRPRCIIFDEVTAMLDPAGRRMVIAQMQQLHRQGITLISITHSMEEAASAGRIIVLHHGKLVLDGSPSQLFTPSTPLADYGLALPPAAVLAHRLRPYLPQLPQSILSRTDLKNAFSALTGLNAASFPAPVKQPAGTELDLSSETPLPGSPPLIEVKALCYTYMAGTPFAQKALNGVDMAVNTARAHGLIGATGSGKSTLLQHLNGILRPQSGSIRVGPYLLEDARVSTKSVIQMVGLVFQNPEMQFFEQYVGDEIAFGPRQLPDPKRPLIERVRWAMEMVGLGFDAFKDRLVYTLSGGEKRKVALASTLAITPSILLLDEPTAGLDPASHQEIITRLKQLQTGGINLLPKRHSPGGADVPDKMTIILSSHQMEDMVALAETLTVFQDGKSILNGTTPSVFAQAEFLDKAGLEPPLAAQAAGWLRKKGCDLPPGIVSTEDLEAVLRLSHTPTGNQP
jgi:energy-coupling factor transport system ATP-binding protein